MRTARQRMKPDDLIPRRHHRDGMSKTPVMREAREGKALILFVVSLPMLFGVLGLVVDGGMLMTEHRYLQQIADAAATAAAWELINGESAGQATAVATQLVQEQNGLSDCQVTVNIPPGNGPYAGENDYVEVIVSRPVSTYFMQVIRDDESGLVSARSVAGIEDATVGSSIVVLDPDPSPLAISGLPITLPTLPVLALGGLEVLGVARLDVDAAIFVNNTWGGRDENGDPAGDGPGPPYGASTMPNLTLTRIHAHDIRVVGGVDNPDNYRNIEDGEDSPLKANARPVPDPLIGMPVPTMSADPMNVAGDLLGHVSVVSVPLIGPPVTLNPGVYESIQILTGRVVFNPGVYIIRNVNPVTQIALSVVAGQVSANGVMFYITDSPSYTPDNGAPDSGDGETTPAAPGLTSMIPSVVINAGLLGSSYSPLSNPGSAFDGVFLYQARHMRQPVVIVSEQLLGAGAVSGIIYAKWGQLLFVGHGDYDLSMVAGTVRIVGVLSCGFSPSYLFPPARDVFLVE